MKHTCHVPSCGVVVPHERLMCPEHWRLVPAALRARVWATYTVGQCRDRRKVSKAWLKAARAAVNFVEAGFANT